MKFFRTIVGIKPAPTVAGNALRGPSQFPGILFVCFFGIKFGLFLDLCVSSLHRGRHANLLCIVLILLEFSGILKPDVMAPGSLVLGAWPPNSKINKGLRNRAPLLGRYNILSGTSIACPHASGVAALLKGGHPVTHIGVLLPLDLPL
jgi:hypothetical protein